MQCRIEWILITNYVSLVFHVVYMGYFPSQKIIHTSFQELKFCVIHKNTRTTDFCLNIHSVLFRTNNNKIIKKRTP